MSEFITYPKPSGASYIIPDVGDSNWGQNVTDFLVAIPNGTVPTAGTFTLTGDLNWGASFGLISQYYKSAAANISTAGALRLAHSDSIGYRNNANGANLLLTVNSSDQLLWNGSVLATGGFVSSITGTANQVIASASTGAVTLSTPQSIGTASIPQFGGLGIGTSGVSGEFILNGTMIMSGGELSMQPDSFLQVGRGPDNSDSWVGFGDGNGHSVNLSGPSSTGATYNLHLPTAQGGSNQVMKNDGSGNLSWATPLYSITTGNLTDVGTDGITVTGGTGAVVGSGTSLAQHVADSTHNGYLSSTDWSTFNGKGAGTVTSVSGTTNQITSTGGATPVLALASPLTTPGGVTITGINGLGIAAPVVASTSGVLSASTTINVNALVSQQSNPATVGTIRLASSDTIDWRNNANSADLPLSKDSSDQLNYNSHAFLTSAGVIVAPLGAATATSLTLTSGTIAMGASKITGLANGTASTDAMAFGQNHLFQVVGATSTTSSNTASGTFQTSNLSASIAPSSASNKIKIAATFYAQVTHQGSLGQGIFTLARGGSNLGGSFGMGTLTNVSTTLDQQSTITLTWLDSPATTSSTTYAMQFKSNGATITVLDANIPGAIILEEVV